MQNVGKRCTIFLIPRATEAVDSTSKLKGQSFPLRDANYVSNRPTISAELLTCGRKVDNAHDNAVRYRLRRKLPITDPTYNNGFHPLPLSLVKGCDWSMELLERSIEAYYLRLRAVICQKQISVEGNGHCCHRTSSNWEPNQPSIWIRR